MSSSSSSTLFDFDDLYTPAVANAIRYIALPPAVVSLTCSLCIIQHIYRSKGELLKNPTYLRLMVGLSCFDVISSTGNIAMTFANDIDVAGSLGCTSTGFLVVTGFSAAMVYNAGLGTYFTLTVVNNVSKEMLQRWFEPIVHFVAIVGVGSIGIAGLFLEVYNPYPQAKSCFVGADGCYDLREIEACGRGAEYGFTFAIVHTLIFVVTLTMVAASTIVLYVSVRIIEQNNQRFWTASMRVSLSNNNNTDTRLSARVARQGTLFCGGVILVTIFSGIHALLPEELVGSPVQITFALLDNFFFPLQGFFDFIVYFQDRYVQWRKACPQDGWWFAIHKTTLTTCTPSHTHSVAASNAGSSGRSAEDGIILETPDNTPATAKDSFQDEDEQE